jgi:hypothetical protein
MIYDPTWREMAPNWFRAWPPRSVDGFPDEDSLGHLYYGSENVAVQRGWFGK